MSEGVNVMFECVRLCNVVFECVRVFDGVFNVVFVIVRVS